MSKPISQRKKEEVLALAQEVGAPIEIASKVTPERWKQSVFGQTHAPAKMFVDTRTGRKISIGQARQVIKAFERKKKVSELSVAGVAIGDIAKAVDCGERRVKQLIESGL